MSFEDRLRAQLHSDPTEVPVDLDAVVGAGREAVRGRRLGWTVAGLATGSVVAAFAVTYLLPPFVPAVPAPAASPSGTPATAPRPASIEVDGRTWRLAADTGAWVGEDPSITLTIEGTRLSGNSGCGGYTASLAREGERWAVEGIINEPISCPSVAGSRAARFLHELAGTTAARVDPGGPTLRLRAPDGELVFTTAR